MALKVLLDNNGNVLTIPQGGVIQQPQGADSVEWGGIGGTLANQTDLQNVLSTIGTPTRFVIDWEDEYTHLTTREYLDINAKVPVMSVTASYDNVSSNNPATSVNGGNAYQATLTAASGYTPSAVITMGGTDITASVYAIVGNVGTINIPEVSGNIVITATAVAQA